MAILILTAFILFFLGTAGKLHQLNISAYRRLAFVGTLTGMFGAMFVVTELLNAVHLLQSSALVFVWSAICLAGIWWLRKNQPYVRLPKKSRYLHGMGVVVLSILLITAVIATFAFPNTWDSMTYHLSRVAQWMARDSVAHYPTNINRQISQPPLTEYAILNILSLSNIPSLANWVQWSAFAGCITLVSLIIKIIGGSFTAQWRGVLIAATIPMAILQSTSTQNDLVVSFFILAALYCLMYLKSAPQASNFRYVFPIVIALAFLTKGTAFIFCIPILLAYAIITLRTQKIQIALLRGLIVIAVCTIALLPFMWRNMQTFGRPLGPDYDLQNNPVGLTALAVNVPMNIAMHLQTPSENLNNKITDGVNSFVDATPASDDPSKFMWLYSPEFKVGFINPQEDGAGNTLHTILFIVSLCILLIAARKHGNKELLIISIIVIAMFLLFCMILKWQAWHMRLHLPMFMIAAVLISMAMEKMHEYLRLALITLFAVGALPFLLLNQSRLFFAKHNIFNSTPMEAMAQNNIDIYNPYHQMNGIIKRDKIDTVGFVCSGDTWEYPFWAEQRDNDAFMLLSILPQNETKGIQEQARFRNTVPEAIISNRYQKQDTVFTYKGFEYTMVFNNYDYRMYELTK